MAQVFCCVLETAGLRTTDQPWLDYRLFSTEALAVQCLADWRGRGRVESWPVDSQDGWEILWHKRAFRACGVHDLEPDPGPVAIPGYGPEV